MWNKFRLRLIKWLSNGDPIVLNVVFKKSEINGEIIFDFKGKSGMLVDNTFIGIDLKIK